MILEFIIIFGISYLGEILSKILSLPVPGTVIGMFLLFIALYFKVIKVKQIERGVDILLINMAIFFIPPGVRLISSLDYMKGNWIKIIVLMILTTLITMVVTGRVVQYLVERGEKNGDN
ncbi:CidA/LrgA family protein [Propionigenium maris DSM 9537]|uniref:CidA/LrgA family protein n=1 Tax=Propionigenium maris DSM 9537 TaxID=1123000 RepID=A0A9W6GNA5_9FUSO|nr:CidA/LrgA family protein [Propionigenium maris]GLI58194.1 CidA/LrgA family protein [Propionigenium maris DSM 9537]